MGQKGTLRHVVGRRVHLERQDGSRPRERKGELKQRLTAVHNRNNYIRILYSRAKFRNPDEFNFKMKSSKLQKGNVVKLKDLEPRKFTRDEKRVIQKTEERWATKAKKAAQVALENHLFATKRGGAETHVFYNNNDDSEGESHDSSDEERGQQVNISDSPEGVMPMSEDKEEEEESNAESDYFGEHEMKSATGNRGASFSKSETKQLELADNNQRRQRQRQGRSAGDDTKPQKRRKTTRKWNSLASSDNEA